MTRVFDSAMFHENATRPNCVAIELKLSQGAKPAHGGMLPRAKITAAIAEARGLQFPATDDCNSPARHSAFDSPESMMLFIAKLRELSGGKPVGFKLFSIKPGSLYSKIGLQNGDVINRINGFEMSSHEKGLEVYQKLKDSSSVTVDIKRRGKPMSLDYAIQ